jgi:hypothetical protein
MAPENEVWNNWVGSFRSIIENTNVEIKKWSMMNGYRGKALQFLTHYMVLILNLLNLKKEI